MSETLQFLRNLEEKKKRDNKVKAEKRCVVMGKLIQCRSDNVVVTTDMSSDDHLTKGTLQQ